MKKSIANREKLIIESFKTISDKLEGKPLIETINVGNNQVQITNGMRSIIINGQTFPATCVWVNDHIMINHFANCPDLETFQFHQNGRDFIAYFGKGLANANATKDSGDHD